MNPSMLGRVHRPDARDYPMMTAFETAKPWAFVPNGKPTIWRPGGILNQGETPRCVGYATAQWLQTTPIRTKLGAGTTGDDIYAACKQVDGYPTDDGSDAHAAMKVMRAQGRVGPYYWASTPEDFARWLSTKTSVLCGTPWHESMFKPYPSGRVSISGATVGGHEYLANAFYPGDNLLDSEVGFVNSWGKGWGVSGGFRLALADLWSLIDEGGDAVAAIQIKV